MHIPNDFENSSKRAMGLTHRYKHMGVLPEETKNKVDLLKTNWVVHSPMAFREETPKILWRTNFIMSITIELIKYEVLTGSLFYSNDAVYIKPLILCSNSGGIKVIHVRG